VCAQDENLSKFSLTLESKSNHSFVNQAKLSSHHPYWLLSGKSYQAAGVAAVVSGLPGASAASTVTGGSSMLGSLTSVIDRAITSTESSEMSSLLAEMRNVLGN